MLGSNSKDQVEPKLYQGKEDSELKKLAVGLFDDKEDTNYAK